MKCIEQLGSVCLRNGRPEVIEKMDVSGRERTMAYRTLRSHSVDKRDGRMHVKFDALISHDITYVGIIQTARASGMTRFPLPYVLTNCHNSLCAVGGTINEDDHLFGLSAAKKYGGIYVPGNLAVIHQFAREKLTRCGGMVLGSDSHTRYGCYGTMGVGEGGGELAKQLLESTWDADDPQTVLIWLEGDVPHGIGPHDVALALTGVTFPKGLVKNKVLEFAGPGVAKLPMDFRTGIDVMTTETSCLSSIWVTDDTVKAFYENVGRPEAYQPMTPEEGACYDSCFVIHLDQMESMIALPFHPSRVYTIHELQADPEGILRKTQEACNASLSGAAMDLVSCIHEDGRVHCDQGIIAGCAGGMYDNLAEAAAILRHGSIGNGSFNLSVYPSSAPINLAVMRDGIAEELTADGAVMKPCFCGPCFGAGDTPANNTLSIRHTTRNFASREGSKPANGQMAAVALMDARSIAATAANGGVLTAATDIDYEVEPKHYVYSDEIYQKRCYFGFGKAQTDAELRFGPNIRDWPKMQPLQENVLLGLCAVIHDDVTTTDELIPSGETSSYRSNPIALSEFALSRRCPDYVGRSKAVRALDEQRRAGELPADTLAVMERLGADPADTLIGSLVFAHKPGDGSAREQAASCQKVLGGFANICYEFATKRYRSNCINWGILPFTMADGRPFEPEVGAWLYVPGVRSGLEQGTEDYTARYIAPDGTVKELPLKLSGLSKDDRQILIEGCLMNYYAAGYGRE